MNKKTLIGVIIVSSIVCCTIAIIAMTRGDGIISSDDSTSNVSTSNRSAIERFIEIEDDGDINVGGIEIFDPEDAIKGTAAVLITKKVAVSKDSITKETKVSTTVADKKVSKRVTTTTTPTTYKKVTKTKVTPKPDKKK